MKKILVLTSTFPRWKNDTDPPFVFELCRRLSKDFQIHVLAPHAPGAAREEIFRGIKITRFPYFFPRWELLSYTGGILSNLKHHPMRLGLIPFFLLGQLIALIRLLQKDSFDCIHAHWLIPQGLLACIASFAVKTPPLLCTSHGGDLFGLRGPLLNRLKRFVAMRSAGVTVVSRAMKRSLCELGVNSDRVQVIPMGVDLQHLFVPPSGKKTEHTLLFVGRLVEKKGVRYLIEAMPEILDKHPQATLKIVGSGQDRLQLQSLSDKLEIASGIEFLGSMDNHLLPPLYQDSTIVVFPFVIAANGDQEGFGLVLVEALGCGCAIVTTDLPAMMDIITHGNTGLVVPQKAPSKIANAVCQLLNDPSLQRRLGREGRDYVLHRFDWRIIADRYSSLIHSLIKRKNKI